jgi:hypothetical protein
MSEEYFEEVDNDFGYSIRLYPDTDAESPREWDNLGEILYTSNNYVLGDRRTDAEEIEEVMADPDYIWLPVYAYIHGGVTIRTYPFHCPWDSGMSGIIAVHKADVREEWGKQRISAKLRAQVLDLLKGEVETLDQFYTGDVWGYVIEDENGEDIDSCGGFYGGKYAKKEALSVARHHFENTYHQLALPVV